MYPILFEYGSFRLHTFGVLLAFALGVGIWYISRLMEKRGVTDFDSAMDLAFWATLGAIVGSRLLFCIVQWKLFAHDLFGIFRIWEGGLVMFGGVIGAFGLGVWKARQLRLNVPAAVDCAMIGLGLGLFLGRFACISAGDDYGLPAPSWFPFTLTFTDPRALLFNVHPEYRGVPLYPTQIFMSLKGLSMFLVGNWLFRKNLPDGVIGGILLMQLAVLRYVIEIFRGDIIERGTVLGGLLSTSQFISFILFAAGAAFVWKCLIRGNRADSKGESVTK